MRSILVCLWIFLSSSVFAANGFGVGAGDPLARPDPNKKPEFPVQAYEPWVKSAKIGDFIVIKYKTGVTTRREVKSIEADVLVVEEKSTSNGKDYIYEKKFSRKEPSKETSVVSRELDMKKSATSTVKLGGKEVSCEVWDGYIKTTMFSASGTVGVQASQFKAARYQKTVAADVPFGGIIKEMQAPDDGLPMKIGGKASERVNNKNENLDLVYEMTDFGNTQTKK